MTDNYDPWNVAANAKEQPKEYFGLVEFDIYPCVLVKGTGAMPFDPQVDKPEQRRTAVNLVLTPLPSANVSFTTERRMIAEFGDWPQVTVKSLNALGITPKDLTGKWARYSLIPTSTYTDKNGVERTSTAIKFLAWYPTEETAEAAATEFYKRSDGNGNGGATASAQQPANDAERNTALLFLKPLAMQAGGDRDKMAALIASNGLVSKYFNVDSNEVAELLAPAAGTKQMPF